MKVFISWSGENSASHNVAIALRDWLPCAISSIKPFVSSEDIQKGERGLSKIEELLNDSGFGILCVTKDNYKAPWLLFEAGALSNNPSKVRVVPFLFGLSPSDLTGSPIIQFQATAYSEKESIKKLIQSLNSASGEERLDDSLLDRLFEKWYPDLKDALSHINSGGSAPESKPKKDVDKNTTILEEILEIARNNQQALANSKFSDSMSYTRVKNLFENAMKDFSGGEKDKFAYKFAIEYTDRNENRVTRYVTISSQVVLADVLDEIYFTIQEQVRSFTYLISWILQEKITERPLVISGVQNSIPAHNIFKKDSAWEVKFLDEPYIPTVNECRRYHRS